ATAVGADRGSSPASARIRRGMTPGARDQSSAPYDAAVVHALILAALVVAVVCVYASRVGLPFRPRRIDVAADQRRWLEETWPEIEAKLRAEGKSEQEISAAHEELVQKLPVAPEGETLEPDGTAIDRRRHVL